MHAHPLQLSLAFSLEKQYAGAEEAEGQQDGQTPRNSDSDHWNWIWLESEFSVHRLFGLDLAGLRHAPTSTYFRLPLRAPWRFCLFTSSRPLFEDWFAECKYSDLFRTTSYLETRFFHRKCPTSHHQLPFLLMRSWFNNIVCSFSAFPHQRIEDLELVDFRCVWKRNWTSVLA